MSTALKFFPLAFVAGAWGFVMFVPYVLVFFATVYTAGRMSAVRERALAVSDLGMAVRGE
jgi:hypothetical protein